MSGLGGTYTGVGLTNPADSPVTVTSSGSISSVPDDIALTGKSESGQPDYNFPWSVTNLGRITGVGTASTGILLEAGGTVTNGLVGQSGYISGGQQGIEVLGTAGTVTNFSTVVATASGATGINLQMGGVAINSGMISGYTTGIELDNAAATVANYGSIKTTGTLSSYGIRLVSAAGSFVTNAATGYLGANGTNGVGLYAMGGAATIANSGLINALVFLADGGSITNQNVGTISGSNAINIGGASGNVTNDGTINPVRTGIVLRAGGSFANAQNSAQLVVGRNGAYALVTSYSGVLISGGTGTVLNLGTVRAAYGAFDQGISLGAGGTVTNGAPTDTTALIELPGSHDDIGVVAGFDPATVVNFATIVGGYGVALRAGGMVLNTGAAASVIGGYFGIAVNGTVSATVINQGTIAGTSGSGIGISMLSSASGTVANAGTIIGNGGTAIAFANTGSNRLVVAADAVFSGVVAGGASASNTLELVSSASHGVLTGLGAEFTNFGSIVFDAGTDWFISGNSTGLSGTISGFAFGDTIEITGITATGSSYAGGVLVLQEASGTVALDFNLPGTVTASDFVVTNVAAGTDVSLVAPCFVAGTRIHTVRGIVPVENLRVGDRVPVLMGRTAQPIVWLGHRHVDCRSHPDPRQILPIRLSAGAFGPGRPFRDLLLSPDHALYLDGALIPVRYLVNGRTIRQEARDEVTYWHIELPAHNVLYAEGVPAESYLDTGNRAAFANCGPVTELHPDFARQIWEAQGCAPLVVHGSKLAAARRRLHHWATALGHRMTDDPGLRVLADGTEVPANWRHDTLHARLPEGARSVRLVSRTWIPAHMHPDADDARSLGIAISRVWLDAREISLHELSLVRGWHSREQGWRWTDGDAWIVPKGASELAVEVMMTGSYWTAREARKVHAA